jgi:hypothetical protein
VVANGQSEVHVNWRHQEGDRKENSKVSALLLCSLLVRNFRSPLPDDDQNCQSLERNE